MLEGAPGLPWAPYQPYTSRIYPTPGNERPAPSDMHQRRVLSKDGGLLDLELSEDPHLLDFVHGVYYCMGDGDSSTTGERTDKATCDPNRALPGRGL